ncbi:ras GEF [Gigaspora margarita]|uniref:Ras GEF n=1 Tax=Gigaspora margarita TaxID=4874 RepID=A0A8H4A8L3_GIGMA|nr:ras GEF [Gigaspora margarita]
MVTSNDDHHRDLRKFWTAPCCCRMLCATSSSSTSTEEIDSDLTWEDDINPKFLMMNISMLMDFLMWMKHWYDEQQSIQDDINFESLTSSPIDSHLPTISTFSQDKQNDVDDILQDNEESRDIAKQPVLRVGRQKSSSGSQKDDDLQPARKQSYHESVSEVEEGGDTDPNISPQQSFEQEYEDDFYEKEPGDHHNIRILHHRLRRLPEVRDLRSVTNLKDLDEKSGKRVSWGTFSSYGVEGSGAATDSVPDSLMSLSQSISKTAPLSKRKGPTKDGSQEIGDRQRTRHTVSRPPSKNFAEAITFEKDTNISRGGSVSRPKRSKRTIIHTHHSATTEPSVGQGPTIAKQFCLIERDLLMQVRYSKRDKKNVKGKCKVESDTDEEKVHVRPIKDGGVDKVIERFNQTIDWVATEIMLTHSLEDRKCLQLSNFATLNQILLGLQSPSVERLRRTWSRVRVTERRILKELNDYISPFDNWKIVRCYVPNIFNAALPSYIEPAPQPPSLFQLPQQPLVNFQKHRTTAAIIKRANLKAVEARKLVTFLLKALLLKVYLLKAPSQGTPSQDTPSQGIPPQAVSSQGTPPQGASLQGTSSQSTSFQSTLFQGTGIQIIELCYIFAENRII